MHSQSLKLLATALVALPLYTIPVISADGGGGGGGGMGGGSGGGGDPVKCRAGLVYNKKTKKCEPPKAGMIDDNSLYLAGRALAMDGRYADAIKVLTLARDKTDPRILNDPDYMPVREYLGEAQLMLGDVAGARLQLSEIEKRCGTGCRKYGLMREQIEGYLKG
jgi:hypothetical protein